MRLGIKSLQYFNMEIIAYILAVPISIFALYKTLHSCADTTFEAWKEEDKAKYPNLPSID